MQTIFILGRRISLLMVSVVVMLASSGCTTILPDHFASTGDAYPDAPSLVHPNDPDTYEKAAFKAAYSDVYRAALVSASQAQLNVTSDDEDKGQIFAKRVVNGGGDAFEKRYFFAIVVKEINSHKTEVTIMAKAQRKCQIMSAGWAVATAGASEAFRGDANTECQRVSKVHWADKVDNQEEVMNQYMTFVRNNLIAAGLY